MISVSQYNTLITKQYLQTQAENQYFERKGVGKELVKPSKIAEELIGMLNADGGCLVFGVSDEGEIQDISNVSNLDDYQSLVFDFIQPPCHIKLEEVFIDDKLIFLYHVEQELERIFEHKDSRKIFLRVADKNRTLDRDQIKKLEYDKNIRKFEDEVVVDFDQEDLDTALLETYRRKLNFQKSELELLYTKHLLTRQNEEYHFKKAAILLFAKDPEKYIPTASVRYIRYQGTDNLTGEAHNVIKDQRFENNIPNLIIQIRDFLRVALNDYYFLDIEQGRFIKVPEYPEAAWLEGVVNALCHRSYNVQGSSVYIKHFDDRLEISNSGPLPAQVTVENIKTERFARNPRIARVLEDLGYVRQLNEGVNRIYEIMEKSMLSQPEYRVQNSNVYLTLRNNVRKHNKTIHTDIMMKVERQWVNLNDTQKSILLYLFTYGQATLAELSGDTAINENTIRTYLNKFIQQGILERQSLKQRDIHAKYAFKQDS